MSADCTSKGSIIHLVVQFVGVGVSIVSLLIILFQLVITKIIKNRLERLTWCRTTDFDFESSTLDRDDVIPTVRWCNNGGSLGKHTVILSTDRVDNNIIKVVSCSRQMWITVLNYGTENNELAYTVVALAAGNIIAAIAGIVLYYVCYLDGLISALAANSLLVLGPLLIADVYILFFRRLKIFVNNVTTVDLHRAVKASALGNTILVVIEHEYCMFITHKRCVNNADGHANIWNTTPMSMLNRALQYSIKDTIRNISSQQIRDDLLTSSLLDDYCCTTLAQILNVYTNDELNQDNLIYSATNTLIRSSSDFDTKKKWNNAKYKFIASNLIAWGFPIQLYKDSNRLTVLPGLFANSRIGLFNGWLIAQQNEPDNNELYINWTGRKTQAMETIAVLLGNET